MAAEPIAAGRGLRKLIGHKLLALRRQSVSRKTGKTTSQAEAGDSIGKSADAVGRIETGAVKIGKEDLTTLLGLYGAEGGVRDALLALHPSAVGKTPWTKLASTDLLVDAVGVELTACRIRSFSQGVFPGWLQAESYARRVLHALTPPAAVSWDLVERETELRTLRRRQMFDTESPRDLTMTVLVDQAVLERLSYEDQPVRQDQLDLLQSLPDSIEIRVVPFECGLIPNSVHLAIHDFPSDIFDPVAYVEGSGHGRLVFGSDQEMIRLVSTFDRLASLAKDRSESTALIGRYLAATEG